MSLSFAHGAIQWLAADAATTVYTVSGLTFQPKALRFYWVGLQSASDAASEAVSERRGVGFAVSTSSRRAVATFASDTAGTSDCGSVAANDCCVCTVDGTGARDGELDLNSITSDGFTLIVDDQGVANITVFWEAWGGSDITVAAVGDIAEPAATGNVDYTVTGFTSGGTDQVVMFAGVQSTAAVNTGAAADSGLHVGFAASTTAADNVTICGNSDDASTAMDTDGYCQDGECLSMIVLAGGTSVNARATLTAFGTDNFRLNWAARATTDRRSIFLAIKGGSWKSGSYTIAGNSGGSTATISGLSFTPSGISLIGRMTAEDTAATATANDRIGFGSGSSTSSRRSMGILDENATASSACEIDTVLEYDSVLCFPSTGGALLSAYDINSMTNSSIQIIVDTAGGVASEWHGYLTFGNLNQNTTPTSVSAAWGTVTPTISVGGINLTPNAVTANWSVVTPTISVGGINLTPNAVTANWSVVTPTISVGGVNLTPSSVTLIWGIGLPNISGGGITTPVINTADITVYPIDNNNITITYNIEADITVYPTDIENI